MEYCIIVKRECEEDYVTHLDFGEEPTRDIILYKVMNMDLNYDDNYGKIEYFKV